MDCGCHVDPTCPIHAFGSAYEQICRDFAVALSKETYGPEDETPRQIAKRLEGLLERQFEARRQRAATRAR